jgi:glutamyl-tRNA synthetase
MISDSLIKMMFPHVDDIPTPDHYKAIYPKRRLSKDAMVTRFAPSPTGFMHLGGIYTALMNKKFAEQSNGTFYLRIEDTDLARSQPEMVSIINDTLNWFGLLPDEGHIKVQAFCQDYGDYGPYMQSQRKWVYQSFIVDLLKRGHAYPCFMSVDELESCRGEQLRAKLKPGCYGKWARWRDAAEDKLKTELKSVKAFVIRLRSPNAFNHPIVWNDLIKGQIKMAQNDIDVVLLKSDGLPTYHFAHVVDDYLMRTTHVIRGDEWLPSVPLHLQLFDLLQFDDRPQYAHLSPIEITDKSDHKTTRRKLSKRKDQEANIQFYFENGFPEEAVKQYLFNLMDSSYLDDLSKNKDAIPFILRFDKMQKHGALYDLDKLRSISQDILSRMSVDELYENVSRWLKIWDIELAELVKKYPDLTKMALAIERTGSRPSKRFTTWKDIRPQIFFVYDELFNQNRSYVLPKNIDKEIVGPVILDFLSDYNFCLDKQYWLKSLKKIALKFGFADSTKSWKESPDIFKGHYGDVATLLRIGVCGVVRSPDLYEVMKVLGQEKVKKRLEEYKKIFRILK